MPKLPSGPGHEHVVGVEEAVRAARPVRWCGRGTRSQRRRSGARRPPPPALRPEKPCAVDLSRGRRPRPAPSARRRLPRAASETVAGGEDGAVGLEGARRSVEPGAHLVGDGDRLAAQRSEQAGQEGQVPLQVAERHHRDAVADQRVVGVVPLRALGVEPDAAARHEVRDLGERRHEQLLDETDVHDRAAVLQQLAVGAHLRGTARGSGASFSASKWMVERGFATMSAKGTIS